MNLTPINNMASNADDILYHRSAFDLFWLLEEKFVAPLDEIFSSLIYRVSDQVKSPL